MQTRLEELKANTINEIIVTEGGYANNKDDSGGETMYGITEAVARKSGYTDDMRDLPREKATEIYEKKYWHAVSADKLFYFSPSITREVVDTAVNMGPKIAAKFLQRSLNILNNKQKLYRDIVADGKIGPVTLNTLRSYLNYRDEKTLLKTLNLYQGAYYIELTERREKDESFFYGWVRNRVSI